MSDATLGQLQSIYSPTEILVNIILSFFLGLFISYIYKITHKGMSYSQSFMITNIFIAMIVCMVIMIIGNSIARAFALVGALSIIRFRTVVKDTKDIAYIFWSLASGMAAGTGSYYIAIIVTTIISVVAIILFKTNYGSIYKSEFLLQFRYDKDEKISTPIYNDVFKELCKSTTLLNSEISGDNKTLKLTFDIYLKENSDIDDFTLKISKLEGISEVSIVASKSDVDY
tara:strand:- start:115 stop:798 length:684 start_codon:yes stop_codon:yes gene_type:complete